MIRHLLGFELRRLTHARTVVGLWLAFPIVLAVIEYSAFGGLGSTRIPKAHLLIVDQDGSFVSRMLPAMFEREPLDRFFMVERLVDPARIRGRFQSGGGAAAAALVIPAGFSDSVFTGGTTTLELVRNPLQTYGPEMSEAVLTTLIEVANRALGEARGALAGAAERARQSGELDREGFLSVSSAFFDVGRKLRRMALVRDLDLAVERPESKGAGAGSSPEFFAYFFPGLLLFSLLFLGENIETRAMRDRIAGRARRVAAAPVHPAQVVAAETALGLVTTLGASVLVLAFGGVFFGIRPSDPLGVAVVLLGYCLFAVGLAKFIFAGAKSLRTAGTVASVVTIMLALFGGGFAPIEIYPSGIAAVSRWTPLGAANVALVDLLAKHSGLAAVAVPAAIVWAWAAAFLGLGLARRWRLHGR